MITALTEITTHNYKNLDLNGGLALGRLNLFIGPNGSGKSNLLALLQFLQQCVIESSQESGRGRTKFEDAVFQLGGARILDGSITAPANVKIEYRFDTDTRFQLQLLVQSLHRQVIIDQEALTRKGDSAEPFTIYQAHDAQSGGSGSGIVTVLNDTTAAPNMVERIQMVPVNELALAIMPKLLATSTFSPDRTPVYTIGSNIIDSVALWRFYNANHMNMADIRSAEPKLGRADVYILPSGENLAIVLHNLGQVNIEFEETIEQAMKAILPDTRRLRVVASGRLSLTVEWYVKGYKEPFFLSEMSDGTVRMLCWAILLNSPHPPSLIAIDEPEIGIHVAWLPILAAWIKEAARRTQVIVSTHSPDLLDHFTDQLDNNDSKLYVFQADPKSKNHFVVNQLMKTAVATQLDEGWQVGDLYRVGDPSVGGWPW